MCVWQNNTYVHIHDQFCQHALWNLAAMVAWCVCVNEAAWCVDDAESQLARVQHGALIVPSFYRTHTHRCYAVMRLWRVLSQSVWLISVPVLFACFVCHIHFLVWQHPCTIKQQRPCSRMMGAWCMKTNNWSRRWHSASSWLSCLHTFGGGDAELGCRNAWWRSNEQMSRWCLQTCTCMFTECVCIKSPY